VKFPSWEHEMVMRMSQDEKSSHPPKTFVATTNPPCSQKSQKSQKSPMIPMIPGGCAPSLKDFSLQISNDY
jgi:hypothetical protein